MAGRKSKKPRSEHRRSAPSDPVQWGAGLLAIVLGVACFSTALAFDTNIHGTFDLSKLGFLYGAVLLLLAGLPAYVLIVRGRTE